MIVSFIDGRFLGHPFFFSIKKNGHGNGCRQRPNSYISVSGPGAFPALSVSIFVWDCVLPRRSLCRAPVLPAALYRLWAWRSLCRARALSVKTGPPGALANPRATHSAPPIRGHLARPRTPPLRSTCQKTGAAIRAARIRVPARPPAPIHVPARLDPFFHERTPKLTVWGEKRN